MAIDREQMIYEIMACTDRQFLRQLNKVAIERSRELDRTARFDFHIGQRVSFNNSRHGIVMDGTVKKIKVKNILVETDHHGRWNVAAGMLTAEG